MTARTVRSDRVDGGIAVITLDRPARLNAIDDTLIDDLHAALDEVERDDAVRAVVLTGADEALELARSVAANPAFAVRLTKEMLRTTATTASLRDAVLLENRTQVLAVYNHDIDRAMTRFRRAAGRSHEEVV